jgi:hypothetical protein
MQRLDRTWVGGEKDWFRDLDSNQDTQLQRLMSYRLDDPGIDIGIVAEPRNCSQTPAKAQIPETFRMAFA